MDNNQQQNYSSQNKQEQQSSGTPQNRMATQQNKPTNQPSKAPNSISQPSNHPSVSKDTLWYLDNYILLRDYYDRTISRIAARCVRMGNIAMEEYPHFNYILDVLEEISDTGNYIIQHKELYPYVERKIKGGVAALRRNLHEYEIELQKNSSPDMIKEDASELSKMKEALGNIDMKDDPTQGAGMNMDDLMNKLMKQSQIDTSQYETYDSNPDTPELKQPVPPKGS